MCRVMSDRTRKSNSYSRFLRREVGFPCIDGLISRERPLCYGLSSLLAKERDFSGVFLGFSSCGRFLFSYNIEFDSSPSASSPCSSPYWLSVYLFEAGRALRRLGKVKLFASFDWGKGSAAGTPFESGGRLLA